MNTSAKFTDFSQHVATLESMDELTEDLFDHTEQSVHDETVTDVIDRLMTDRAEQLHIDSSGVALEHWGEAQPSPGMEKTLKALKRAGEVSTKGFLKVVETFMLALDRTGTTDLDLATHELSKRKGDSSGEPFLDKQLAHRLSINGKAPQDAAKLVADLSRYSSVLVDRVASESARVLAAVEAALRSHKPGNVDTLRATIREITKAVESAKPLSQLIDSSMQQVQWPGGYALTHELKVYKDEGTSKLARRLQTERLDIDLKSDVAQQETYPFLPTLSRSECHEVLRRLTEFLRNNHALADKINRNRAMSANSLHLANRISFMMARDKARKELTADELAELRRAAIFLKRYDYMSPQVIVRRIFNRNLDMIRNMTRYVRACIKRFD